MALTREEVAELVARGATEEEIFAADDSVPPAPGQPLPGMATAATRQAGGRARSAVLRALPGALGAAGGIVPGATGAALGGLGGMVGKGIQMAATGERPGPALPIGAVAGHPLAALLPPQIMQAGAEQAILGTGGTALSGLVRGVGQAAYRGAARPTSEIVRRFPNAISDAMRLKVPLGGAGARSGEAIAGKKLGEAVARQDVLLDAAEQAGITVPTAGAETMARQLIDKVSRSGLKVNQRVRLLEKELDGFIRDNAANLTPNQANLLVQALGDEIEAVFSASAKGTYIKGGQRLVTKLQERLHRGMNAALRGAVPGIQKAKRATQAAMGAQALTAHARTNIAKGVPAKVPIAPTWLRGFMPDEMRTIDLWSRLGLTMDNPILLAALRQSPRGLAAAFQSGQMPPDTLSDDTNRRSRGTEGR